MAAALPITKLAGLFVKTLAKPLAKRIKHDFSRFPVTQRFLVGLGQTSHTLTSRLTIWSAGYKVRSITPLEKEKAMSQGADLLGESIVFLVSGGVVVWEYNRSKEKERQKDKKAKTKLREDSEALQAKLHTLDVRLKALEKVVKSNSRSILIFGERYQEPVDVVPIDDHPFDGRAAEDLQPTAAEFTAPAHQSGRESASSGGPVPVGGSEDLNDQSKPGVGPPIIKNEDGKPRRWGWWGWWPF